MKNNNNKLSVKNRLTIWMKKTKPISLGVLLIISAVLLVSLVAMSFGGEPEAVAAPEELTNANVQFRMSIAGDVRINDSTRKLANRVGYENLLQGLSEYWSESDCVIANISGPVLRYDVSHYNSRRSTLDEASYLRPAALRGFIEGGINVFSFANDDAFNYGVAGLTSTLDQAEKYDVQTLGIVRDSNQEIFQTYDFSYKEDNRTKSDRSVSVLSVNDIVLDDSTARSNRAGLITSSFAALYENVFQMSQSSDCVVVYVHFGTDNSAEISDEQQELAHTLVDAGADLVVGCHSHMVQPIERYNNGLIVYGLGNLISTEDYSIKLDGAVLDLTVESDDQIYVNLTPIHIIEGCPVVSSESLYQHRVQSTLTSQLEEDEYTITPEGMIRLNLSSLEKD